MKTILCIILWMLFAACDLLGQPWADVTLSQPLAVSNAPPAGGGGNEAFTDDFNRANGAIGANWAVGSGGYSIADNVARPTSESYVENIAAYATPCDTVSQYVRVTVTTFGANNYAGVIFRYTDSSSPCYALYLWQSEDKFEWVRKADAADGSFTTVQSSGTITVAAGDVWGITITGTGTSTVVRVWKNPTGTPSAADNWNGDTTPDATFTDNPASAVDTGNYVGLCAEINALGNVEFDDFAGGDIP